MSLELKIKDKGKVRGLTQRRKPFKGGEMMVKKTTFDIRFLLIVLCSAYSHQAWEAYVLYQELHEVLACDQHLNGEQTDGDHSEHKSTETARAEIMMYHNHIRSRDTLFLSFPANILRWRGMENVTVWKTVSSW